MGFVIPNAEAVYFPVPKCACTSLKLFAFEVANGHAFVGSEAHNKGAKIHGHIPTTGFEKELDLLERDLWSFAVIRHPVDRIVSVYESKFASIGSAYAKRKPIKRLRFLGIRLEPSIDEFIADFERYRLLSWAVKTHSEPLCYYLGDEPSKFSRIYDISETFKAMADLNGRAGTVVPNQKKNVSAAKVADLKVKHLAPETYRAICDRFESDFDIFGDYFAPSRFAPS